MRGKPVVLVVILLLFRIIPAHAGQTRPISSTCLEPQDHPRACGANSEAELDKVISQGSSPRMRGKRGQHRVLCAGSWIIPAHAGQTSHHPRIAVPATDHPRACGANVMWHHSDARHNGSSPRMRGKPYVPLDMKPADRIIPAHAGQTRNCGILSALSSDHPRACGANQKTQQTAPCQCGSSPRMRGKLVAPIDLTQQARIIPAHAGQTAPCRRRWW